MAKDQGQAAPPAPPSVGSGISDYIDNYPRLIQAQEDFGARDLQSQRDAQAQVYPEYEQLRGDLLGQVQRGISEDAPEYYANQVSDTIKSQFGRNAVFNPLGQQQFASQYQSGLKGWQDYWRNLAASFSDSQPVFQSQGAAQGFTPGQAISSNQAGYSSYLPAWSGQQTRQYGAQQQQNQIPFQVAQGAGNVLSGVGSFYGGE